MMVNFKVDLMSKQELFSSHPETTFPDENIHLPAILFGQKSFKKDFWRELQAGPRMGTLA
ncbi:MAG: hypothetical protein V2B13_01540 [Pseudomonadota bacterium]